MPFHHTYGNITAPNEIDQWFTIFEAWIRLVGWTVESGTGTDDLVIRSLGEDNDKTSLYIHVWRVPASNVVRLEARNNLAGTHETTLGQGLNSGGVDIEYWMSADMDAIAIVWNQPADYYLRYCGLVMPFALNPPDETYYMVTAYRMTAAARVLRRYDGAWDQADNLYWNEYMEEAAIDRDDGSFPLGGLYFGDHADVAGQLKHLSCRIRDAAIQPLDTITTHQESGDTEWIILRDESGYRYALRTGGIDPIGDDMGTFQHVEGVAYTAAQLFDAVVSLMQSNGFTANDISAASGRTHDWEFNSVGESGTDDVWIRTSWSGAPVETFQAYVADAAYGTPGRHETTAANMATWDDWVLPTQFYISGDKDCLLLTLNIEGRYEPCYAGLVMPTAPGLSSSYMSAISLGGLAIMEMRILEDHAGLWDQAIEWQRGAEELHTTDSSPNNYDGHTTVLWAINTAQPMGLNSYENVGQVKYMYFADGEEISFCDIVRVADQIYKMFWFSDGANMVCWGMRVA